MYFRLVPLLALTASSAFAATNWNSIFYPTPNPSVDFGVSFDGADPFARRADQAFRPASTAKLLTAAVALEHLGPDFKYETVVSWRETEPGTIADLRFLGEGDPSWGMMEFGEDQNTRLRAFATELRDRGVKKVLGAITFSASDARWSKIDVPRGWMDHDLLECYGALPETWNIGLNCELFTVTGLSTGRWSDPLIGTKVKVSLSRASTTSLSVRIVSGGFEVRGTLASGATSQVAIPVRGVDLWMKAILKRELAAKGIEVLEAATAPTGGTAASFTIYSPSLSAMLKPFLKQSLNLMGESFQRTLGERFSQTNADRLSVAGAEIFRETLARFVPGNSLVAQDGSGLSRESAVTASSMRAFLTAMSELRDFEAIYEALPIAGVDGTLRNRMQGTAARGVLRAKTGTLSGVANLAGYIPLRMGARTSDSLLPFVVLGTSTSASVTAIRAGQDRAGPKLVQLNTSVFEPFRFFEGALPVEDESTLRRDPRLKYSTENAF